MFLANIILAIGGIVVILLGFVVLASNPRRSVNRWLFAFILSSFLWLVANLLTNISSTQELALLFARLTLPFAVFIPLSFLMFSKSFYGKKLSNPYVFKWSVVPLIFILFTFSDLNIESIESYGQNTNTGPLYYLLIPYILIYLTVGLGLLRKQYIRSESRALRNQLKYIFAGFILSFVPGLATNAILPALGASWAVFYGPLSVVILSIFLTLGIVRHRFLDIRPIVARTVGYVMALGILISAFSITSSLLVRSLFNNDFNGILPIIVNASLFAVAALSYPGLKRYFDKLTNRVFYRDAYDPQEFLDQLNKSIVSNIEIGILLRRTTAIIEDNLKCSFVQIVIPKTESTEQRIVGTKDVKYTEHEINYMRGRLVGLRQKILALDELGPEEDELQKIMNKHDIAVLAHLSATSYGQEQTIAYMIFGVKKSGNIYSKQDLKIIDIIADELVIAIQNALRFEEIQEFNVTLQSKVTSATNKLRRTNDKLKALDETKDEFISMASHQLRTPLTSVKGYLSMVLEGDAGEINPTQRKLLDQAFVSSQRMVYLIADLLNVSRLKTGKFVIDSHQANLADMIEGEVSQLKEQAAAKGIALNYDKPAGFPDLMIDETKLRQVVMNFIDNALYYTPAGGRIDVALTQDKNHAYFTVKDNGLGVPKDEQKHLFTKFYRAKNARKIRPDGTGLGLFMAKKVITAQGGNILFTSVEGKGSTFGFSLPLKELAVAGQGEAGG